MTQQRHISGGWVVGLALLVGGLVATPSFAQGVRPPEAPIASEVKTHEARTTQEARARDARMADGYSVTLRAPDVILQHQSVSMDAVVRNAQGQQVDGIPVTFRIEPDWQQDANIMPQEVMVQDGKASTYFKAAMPGRVLVTAQVGNATATKTILVDAQGSSISDNYRAPTSGEASQSIVP